MNEDERDFYIYVRTITGKSFTIYVTNLHTILDVKNIIQDLEGIPADQSRLIFNGQNLSDESTIKDYGIKKECTISLVLTLKKPVVLFYNYQTNQEISCKISLKPDFWKFSHVLPKPNSVLSKDMEMKWNFTFIENLKMIHGGTERPFPYIFWEADTLEGASNVLQDVMTRGFYCFPKSEVLDQIDTILKLKGLNVTERNDLITFWIQDLTSKNYCQISFIEQDYYNEFADLEVLPKPDQLIRVIMLLKPTNEFEEPNLKVEDLVQMDRSEQTLVVEWGGLKLI